MLPKQEEHTKGYSCIPGNCPAAFADWTRNAHLIQVDQLASCPETLPLVAGPGEPRCSHAKGSRVVTCHVNRAEEADVG